MAMRKFAVTAVVVGLLAGMASASMQSKPIESIFSPGLITTYSAADGSLVMSDTRNTSIVIQYTDNTQYTFDDGSVTLTASLASDDSAGGRAMADFAGGSIELKDGDESILFQADVIDLTLEESTELPAVLLSGSGTFANATGELADLFTTSGQIIENAYNLPDLTDFSSVSSDFTGQSNMILQVPEPATMSVLALGGLAVMLRKRSR